MSSALAVSAVDKDNIDDNALCSCEVCGSSPNEAKHWRMVDNVRVASMTLLCGAGVLLPAIKRAAGNMLTDAALLAMTSVMC